MNAEIVLRDTLNKLMLLVGLLLIIEHHDVIIIHIHVYEIKCELPKSQSKVFAFCK